ncbi:hypothetical protein, conserved [Eimeria necatrix]|uniref:Uncharacterized protein n=1 Tax=Eimeria necatrix TaxID=51315 RepID=U6MSA1_9EIME|nr:hypothetical protein, conserved [Eimeria necatrix]CDJ67057.1 hypothetical protein, conserved [Eimeria necatrix]
MDSLLSLDARWTAEASEGRFKREDQDKDVANGREGGAREPPCSRIYRLLQQIVRPEWHSIPDPTSPKWLEEFQSRVEAKEPLVKRPSNPPSAGAAAASGKDVKQDPLPPQEDPAADAEATAFESFSTEEEFLLLSKITSRLDTPWVQALRRLRAIEECEASRPLELNEVINYAKRIAGSVAAPPETANIVDVVAHQTAFPNYHFLPYPSMEELQNSRLAALGTKPYAEICFPPDVAAKLVYLQRDAAFSVSETPQGVVPAYDTTLLSSDMWQDDKGKEVFYELRFTSATPCCTFWFAVANGQWPASQPLPRDCPVRQLPSLRPLLVPGPFPKTVRVQCRKQGKKHSRITQTCLKLKGAAANRASMAPQATSGQRQKGAADQRAGDTGLKATGEEAGVGRDGRAATPEGQPQAPDVSQFHGFMLGTARRRGKRSRDECSSDSSSGSSSEGD